MKVKCPICHEVKKMQGLQLHLKNSHPEEFKKDGYWKIKEIALKDIVRDDKEPPTKAELLNPPKDIQKPDEGLVEGQDDERAIHAWNIKSGQTLRFTPTPTASMVINQFGNPRNPSDVINKALNEFASSRGLEPAIIRTEGGKAVSLLGGDSESKEDREFNKILKLIAANNTVNQSYNQFTPASQMMEVMKNRVSKGMGMGEFAKEMVNMVLMMKMMEGL